MSFWFKPCTLAHTHTHTHTHTHCDTERQLPPFTLANLICYFKKRIKPTNQTNKKGWVEGWGGGSGTPGIPLKSSPVLTVWFGNSELFLSLILLLCDWSVSCIKLLHDFKCVLLVQLCMEWYAVFSGFTFLCAELDHLTCISSYLCP